MIFNCPWCGNTWEQEEQEPHRCKVCNHYPWEGTQEMHMQFQDITAWEEYQEQLEWDYMAHTDIRS